MTHESNLGVLAITHYVRVLTELRPDRVHVMLDGRIARSGGRELADQLEEQGYEGIAAELVAAGRYVWLVVVFGGAGRGGLRRGGRRRGRGRRQRRGGVLALRRLGVLLRLRGGGLGRVVVVVVTGGRTDVAVAGLHRGADDVDRLALLTSSGK